MRCLTSLRILAALAITLATQSYGGVLSDIPLSIKGSVPPNVMFALSVEFPTANTAAYQDTGSYSVNNQYLGYFDDAKCYRYDGTNGWFYPTYTTTTHLCTSGGWSGNLLNWATMTGLDEFRFAMTGGNRSTDTSTTTVLERSYQSGQGGTSNFPDKTFLDTDSYSTTYPAGTSLTFQNQGRGAQVAITPSGSTGVLNCTSPTLTSGTFSCTLTTTTGISGACYWWVGNGTSASPYTCTSMQIGGDVPNTLTTITPPSAASSGASNTAVTCASPSISGTAFTCGSLTLSNGSTGTCNVWTGDGTAAHPYTCSSFSAFSNGETFFPTGAPTSTSFSTTTLQTNIVEPSSSTYMTCSMGTGPKLSCNLSTGSTAACTTFSTTKKSSKLFCTGFGSNGPETITAFANDGSSTTSYGGSTYYNKYQITYQKPVSNTVYYTSSYPGTTAGYYYTSAYNYGFSGSQIYNVRVKVCDSTVGLEDNCKLYGSTYKPTGVVQDNGDKMRFGVTSYFLANDIDNAVLRSKAKYVAPLKYSPSGGIATNALAEWSSTDGTLLTNPDATDSATATSYVGAMSNTGVINYINKFGSSAHSYKTYDTVGKLYYETLKYLRGTKAPTTDFYNGAKATNADGFPVINQWDDPVLYSCQKNYIITMGDTHTWCDKRLPGGTFSTTGSTACNAYTDGNGNSHAQDTGSLGGDTGVNVTTQTNKVGTLEGNASLATTGTGVGTAASYSMAGLSQWAASQDVRGDLVGKQTVKTYVIDVEENKDCGYNSQFWYTAKYGNPASYDSNGNWLTSSNPWASSLTLPGGACSSRSPTGYNTAGGAVTWPANLLRAADPVGMIASVRSAITEIVAQIGDEAALAQSSGFLDTGTGAYIYRATYNSGGWTGDVQALTINTSGTIAATPAWSASAQLPTAANRKVFTFNDGYQVNGTAETSTNARLGVAFTSGSFSSLSSRQQALLNTDSTGSTDALGADRISYILGDQSKEAFLVGTTTANTSGHGWRSRNSRLGDVINSNPAYVGAPNAGYSYATYKAFAIAKANRTPIVYVGGNDGMLHAYDASFTYDANGNPLTVSNTTNVSGREVFAYVPSAVYRNLSQLMSPNYSHKYFVDGSPTISDACFGSCASTSDWKTVLLSGLNAGGQGIFALDVTDPVASFTTANVLWEFTDLDDADLGSTFSRPIIRKLNNGKWAAIFGNGYNNTTADGNASTTGRAALYIVYLDGPGAGNHWTLGTNYFKISLRSPSESTSPTLPQNPTNGLSAVSSLDTDLNGTVDYIYSGDRYGNLWKIDLTSSDPTQWGSAFKDSSTPPNPLPLFTAKNASGNTQQITTGISIAPAGTGRTGYMVMFGTGAWIDTTDPVSPFTTDSLYGIWDTPLLDTSTKTTTNPGTTYTAPVSGRSSLQQQKTLLYVDANGNAADSSNTPYTATSVANGIPVYAIYSTCEPYYLNTFDKTNPPTMPNNLAAPLCPSSIAIGTTKTGTQRGWYMDLTAASGERVRSSTPNVSNQATQVSFTTLSPATDPCSGNTIGLEYNLAVETGGAPRNGVFVNNAGGTVSVSASAFSGYTGSGTVKVVLGGTAIVGGASDNAISFNAIPPSSVISSPTNVAPPTSTCTGTNCANFVQGWGFLMNLRGPTAANSNVVLSCSPPEFGTGLPNCTWKYKNGTYGRLSWRQLTH